MIPFYHLRCQGLSALYLAETFLCANSNPLALIVNTRSGTIIHPDVSWCSLMVYVTECGAVS